MSVDRSCFVNVIGLSRTDCECYGTGKPADFDLSNSGLYLDEAPALNLARIFSVADCEADGWKILERSRERGTKAFTDAVLRIIRRDAQWMKPPMKAQIGDSKDGTLTISLGKQYHGVHVYTPEHIGGAATLKRIATYVKFTGVIAVDVYIGDSETPETSFNVNATANKVVWTDIDPIDIPLGEHVWFLWEPAPGQQALNPRIHCGCSGTPTFDCSRPWWAHMPSKNQEWYKWAMANGTSGNLLSDRDKWTHNNSTQGLMLDIDFTCDARTSICRDDPDYEGDPVQAAFAWGVLFASALDIVQTITGSTRVVREAIAGGDEMERLRVSYMAKVNEYAEYIGEVLTMPADNGRSSGVNSYSDCFTCRDTTGIAVKTIRR